MSPTQVLIIIVRCVLMAIALGCLMAIAKNRMNRFQNNHVARESSKHVLQEPWYELAVCFGPRLSLDSVLDYKRRDKAADPMKLHASGFFSTHHNVPVNSMKAFKRFFLKSFNWSNDSMYVPGSDLYLFTSWSWKHYEEEVDYFSHRFSINMTTPKADVEYLSFQHAMCRNYTYQITFKDSTIFEHTIRLEPYQYKVLLQHGWFATYADIFVYPKGHMTEFPLIRDNVPFRVDLIDWLRLRINVKKIVHLPNKPGWSCQSQTEFPSYSHTQCLTWCLRRALLRRIVCTFPQLDAYIYNMTKIIDMFYAKEVPGMLLYNRSDMWYYHREAINKRFRTREYFNPSTVLPWMRDFMHLPLCDTAKGFKDTFAKLRRNFYPMGEARYPLDSTCATQCPPECDEYRITILTEGQELQKPDKDHSYPRGISIYYAGTVNVIKERWLYRWQQLFIDMSGVMSFFLGLSVISIYDWCFNFISWLMVRANVVEAKEYMDAEQDDVYESAGYDQYDEWHDGDDEYYDDYQYDEGDNEYYDDDDEQYSDGDDWYYDDDNFANGNDQRTLDKDHHETTDHPAQRLIQAS